jgi:salicylate 5-hydroxylase large subunit
MRLVGIEAGEIAVRRWRRVMADGGAVGAHVSRRWPEQAARVPNWVYTDPDIFAREQELIFSGPSWLYTCLEAEIPNPGDFKRSQLGNREVVAVRNKDGTVNVFVNRCAHRSMQVCMQNRGTVKEFVCPYHQWTYDLDGKLLGLPFRRGYKGNAGMPADFDPAEHGLETLAVACRNGVVFASFAQPNETFETYLGPKMLGYFDRVFDGRKLEVLGYMRQRIPSNWKLMMENIKDPYHASLLHVFLISFGLFRADQESSMEMDETGRHGALVSRRAESEDKAATGQMRSFRERFTLQDPRLIDPVREFPGPATVVLQTIWPNLIVQQQSNALAMRQIVPLDPHNFDLVWTVFAYQDDPPELRERRMRQANLFGPAGLVSIDDSEAMLLSQAGIIGNDERDCVVEMGGREIADAPTAVTETLIRGMYRHYRAVMGL